MAVRFCYSGLQSEGPPRHEHDSDTKRGVASAMKPPDKIWPWLRDLAVSIYINDNDNIQHNYFPLRNRIML